MISFARQSHLILNELLGDCELGAFSQPSDLNYEKHLSDYYSVVRFLKHFLHEKSLPYSDIQSDIFCISSFK